MTIIAIVLAASGLSVASAFSGEVTKGHPLT